MAPTMTFRKTGDGYLAHGTGHAYSVRKVGARWKLIIAELAVTAGVAHSIGTATVSADWHDTKALAVATARAFEALGEDYNTAEHGGQRRFTAAVNHAYEEN